MRILILITVFLNGALALPVLKSKFIDLTYPINNDTLNYASAPNFRLLDRSLKHFKSLKYIAGDFCSGEHVGTHIDAPFHFAFEEKLNSVSEIPVETLQGPAVVVDITERAEKDRDAIVTKDDLIKWEAAHGEIPDGSIVFMRSGWGKYYYTNATAFFGNSERNLDGAHFPGFGKDAVDFLVDEREIFGIGVDTPSLDTGKTDTFPAHRRILFANKYGLELVANLEKLPPSGAHVYVLPMKLDGGSGAPTRILAQVPNAK